MNISVVSALLALTALLCLSIAWVVISRRRLVQERRLRHDMEERLRDKEEYLRTIIATEPECVKLMDINGNLLDINPAGARLIEAESPDALRGCCVYDYVVSKHLPAFRSLTESVFSGNSGKLVFELLGLKGSRRWMETHAVPMRNRDEKIVALLAITRDITARKHAEESDMQHQEELLRACRLLSVGEMASALAHELNQPICAIMTYAEAMINNTSKISPDLAMLKQLAEKISGDTDRAAGIIRSIRQFVSKTEPSLSRVNISQLITEVTDFLNKEAERRGVEIRLSLPESPGYVLGDSIQIQQVLINLINNGFDAVRNNPDNDRILEIHSKTTGAPGMVSVDIRDNGSGVDTTDTELLFKPFYTTKNSGGIGIGLSLSRTIIESHNGQLQISGNQARGVTASFSLPAFA